MKTNRNNRLQKSKLIPVKYILLLLLSFLIGSAQAQKELLDTLKITPGIKIIGMYPNSDQQKTYRLYNFIIEDPAKIQEFVKHVKLGAETPNSFEFNGFGLLVIKDFMRIGSWTINPKLKNAMVHDGHSYAFDFEQISSLNKQFPFDYEVQKKTFGKKAEFETFLARQKNNANFLFYYAPQFRYEGSFEITFKKTEKLSNPKAINEFLKPYIEALVKPNDYRLAYILDDKNMRETDQYTMTITGPKTLFEQLKVEGYQKENWKPTEELGTFYYKK